VSTEVVKEEDMVPPEVIKGGKKLLCVFHPNPYCIQGMMAVHH
jgi:hypothetical protein